jgi:TonB-linked SusC/RagA family outer membrane protein
MKIKTNMNGQLLPWRPVLAGLMLFLLVGLQAWSQQAGSVRGQVTDAEGTPLIGVTVMVKGEGRGTVTDIDGYYSLPLEPGDAVLVYSYIGYLSREIPIEGRSQIDLVLQRDVIGLSEVVVVGYGTQRRATVTSSIATVKEEDFIPGAVNNPLQMIRGRVAGLAINRVNGNPNDGNVQLMLRGVSTLQGNSQPLIVIDGIPGGSLNTVSPDDIESIDVLKDGSAAAIYGTRGNNGVILITTKRGARATGAPTVTYHGYVSAEQISNKIEVFSAEEYRKIPELTNGFFEIVDQGHDTDWWGEVSRSPLNQNHNISIRGGTVSSNYVAAADYRGQEGLLINTGIEQLRLRLGINHNLMDDRLRFSLNVSNNITRGRTNDQSQIYFATRIANPTESIKDESGAYSFFAGVNNAVQMAREFEEDINWNQTLLNGRVVAELIDGLNVTVVGALQRFSHLNGWYGNRMYNIQRTGEGGRNTSLNQQLTFESYADYSRNINRHEFVVLGGYSFQDFTWEGFNLENHNFPSDAFGYARPDLGYALSEGLASMGGNKGMSRLIAFFSRVNYSFDDKYLFSASIRREGSTKFGENNRWGWFPAVSAGWVITREPFMAGIGFLNELKLRAGYGVTGTEPHNSYLSQMRFDYHTPTFYEGRWIYSIGPTMNPNPNLKWETKHEANIGLDFALLNNRLGGSVDFYMRNTRDLLYSYNVPVPPNLVSTILANVGEISNQGVELYLNAAIVERGDLWWNVSTNFSYNTNNLVKLSDDTYKRDFLEVGNTGAPVQKNTHRVEEGMPLGNFFGWKSVGLDENGAWVIDGGEYGVDADRQILGNGIPKMFAGFTTGVGYKGLDLSVSLRGAFGFQILNQYRMLWENFIKGQQYNFPVSILDHPYGTDTWVKTAPAYVSYYVEDGDYLKIDNVTLGYNFRVGNLKHIQVLRLYVSGTNLYTFTNYKGVDPEINFIGLSPGIDLVGGYPTTRMITAGIKLSL